MTDSRSTLLQRRRTPKWAQHMRGNDAAVASVPDPRPPVSAMRMQVQQQLFREIGEFLLIHNLDSSPRNYAVAYARLWGEQPSGNHADEPCAASVHDAGSRQDRLDFLQLAKLAAELEDHLATCTSAMDHSHLSTATFSCALDEEARKLSHDPHAALERIVALTCGAVDTMRLVGKQLQRMRDETQSLRAELNNARRAAERDHLTGLPNRRFFEARAEALLNRADVPQAQVALCDVDDFKQINDRFGHSAGDRVLKYIADFLKRSLEPEVTLARYGGEEFACLFENMSAAKARALLDDARIALAARSLVNKETGEPIGALTFSAGIATLSREGVAHTVQQADARLYCAKRNGKNAVIAADERS